MLITSNRFQVVFYVIISYIITWSIAFFLVFQLNSGKLSEMQQALYHSLAAIGPAIASVVTILFFQGRNGISQFLLKFKKPDWNIETILFTLSPLFFFGIGNVIYRIANGYWFDFGFFVISVFSDTKKFIVWVLPLITYPFFEEIGWRGFLLPQLQKKFNALYATLLLSLIWAFWHLPFFFYRFHFSIGISIGFFFGILMGAIILTSIYNSSKGALIPVIIFHFLNNLCSEFEKKQIVATISVGYFLLAVFIIFYFGKKNMSKINAIDI